MVHLILAAFRRQKMLYLMWLLSLSAAVTGLVTVDVFRASLADTLRRQGRQMLTADVALSSRQRLAEGTAEKFRAELPPDTRFAQLTEMFGMISSGRESRLGLLRAISDDYPLIGDLEVDGVAQLGDKLGEAPSVWVASDVLPLLGVKSGATIKVGGAEFKITGIVGKDSSQTFRFGAMAPRVYIHKKYLEKTGLIQFGSTFSETWLAELSAPPAPDLKKRLEASFADPAINITVPADLEQGALQVLRQLLDYLGLTGLVTLALGWIGVYYLGRRWLTLEMHGAGLLKCLGLSNAEVRRLLLTKLLLVITAGVALGGLIAWVGANALMPFVRDSMPADFQLVWSWKNSLLLLGVGPFAGLLLLYGPIAHLAAAKPLGLFQERSEGETPSWRGLLPLIALTACLFVALTFLQARSWRVTGAFLITLGVSLVVIAALGYGAVKLVRFLKPAINRLGGWRAHLLAAIWTRRTATSVLLISVSALAGLLSQLLPHLEKTLVGELQSPREVTRPALFMVDIQEEQLEPLKAFLNERGIEVSFYSPFVRARILSVNNSAFERGEVNSWSTREDEAEARFRNRGVNLSYRQELSPSEKIVAGKPWSEIRKDPPEISVEEGYAKRLKLKLGDKLKFDIQGLELEAEIVSLRKINWDSFMPNFFIQFPDGVLNDAPKTWILTVQPKAGMESAAIQSAVTRAFPNITSINVKDALDRVSELVKQLSGGLKMASRLCLALGLLVFLLILTFQLMSARKDARQLSVLGLTSREIWWLQVLSYGGLCLLGTVIGGGLSMVVAWGLISIAFDSVAEFDAVALLQIWLLTIGTALTGVAVLGAREVRRARGLYGDDF